MSLAGDHRSSKKDLKERISGMFKRAGSSSRSGSRAGSQEKILNDSQQRPISIASNGSSSTLPTNFTLQQVQSPPAAPKAPVSCARVCKIFTSHLSTFFIRENHQRPPANESSNQQPSAPRHVRRVNHLFVFLLSC